MAFVPATCTQCGASIKVDENKDAGICEHCGTAFVTEKVINNYNTTISNTTVFNNANVTILDAQMDKLQKSYAYFLNKNNYPKMEQILKQYILEYPYDKFGYEQKLIYISNRFSNSVDLTKLSLEDLYEYQAQLVSCLSELRKINKNGAKQYELIAKPFHDNFDNLVKEKQQLILKEYEQQDMARKQEYQRQYNQLKESYFYTNKKAKKALVSAVVTLIFSILSPIASIMLVFPLVNGVDGGVLTAILFSIIMTGLIVMSVILPIICKKNFTKYNMLKKEADSFKLRYEHME